MKKIVMGVVAVAFMCIALVGCSEKVTDGMVVDKKYSPQSSYIVQQCSMFDSKGVCTMYTPVTHTIPEKWSVTIQGKNSSGETDETTYRISENNFDEIQIGDHLVYDEESNSIQIM